jgi:putative hydrolase of the HAD superfamily
MSLVRTPVVFLDVGFTLTFIDGARVSALAAEAGLAVTADAVEKIEAAARGELHQYAWAATPPQAAADPALAHGGPRFFARVLDLAGATSDKGASREATEAERQRAGRVIWDAHLQSNVWCRLGAGVEAAVSRLHEAGVRLAVVSNSEGTVARLLEGIGLARYMETIIDSWVVQVAKPSAKIFRIALERMAVESRHVTMVGDSLVNDVRGGRNAGMRAAFLDPFGDAPLGEDVPTFPNLPAFVEAFFDTALGASN